MMLFKRLVLIHAENLQKNKPLRSSPHVPNLRSGMLKDGMLITLCGNELHVHFQKVGISTS